MCSVFNEWKKRNATEGIKLHSQESPKTCEEEEKNDKVPMESG